MARHKAFDQESVLQQAMELFWQQGYEATSIRDLITHLSISSSSMYETFGDKHALYLAALAYFRRVEYEKIETQLATATSATDTLRGWFEELINSLLADEHYRGSFTVNAAIERGASDPEVAAQLQAHFDKITALLAEFLQLAQQSGEIAEQHDPISLAQFFISTLFGMCSLIKIYPNRQILENVALNALANLN